MVFISSQPSEGLHQCAWLFAFEHLARPKPEFDDVRPQYLLLDRQDLRRMH